MTGRMIVTIRDNSTRGREQAIARLQECTGVSGVCHASDFSAEGLDMDQAADAGVIVMDTLGMAILNGDADQMSAASSVLSADQDGVIVEPEYINWVMPSLLDDDLLEPKSDSVPVAAAPTTAHLEYLRGYYDAVKHLYDTLRASAAVPAGTSFAGAQAGGFSDSASSTWGLQATGVPGSPQTGKGIKVAVLDTGLDTGHADFKNRKITTRSFIPGESAKDVNGHGTHCTGTACGPLRPAEGPRYGIAYESEIFHGKVLSNSGSGGDGGILGAIEWAVANGCQVISMSLGRRTQPGEPPTAMYETAGRRALNAGSLVIAAAGNDSDRKNGRIIPVSSPANASSIVAVAAIDAALQVANFSNGGLTAGGGEINLAAPGVSIRSALPRPRNYASWSGTSMATPHVAGIAALIAQQSASFRGIALYRELRRRAQRLALPGRDVGNGLVRAV
jgi:subtilisin family serine protease